MVKTSIKIRPCNVDSSEKINYRRIKLEYVTPELSIFNESWESDEFTLSQHLEEIKKLYKTFTGQRMQRKASPIREGAIVIQNSTTMEQLLKFSQACKARWGIKALQIHIHRDVGEMRNGAWIPNPTARIIWDWCTNTGISRKLSKRDMAEMQVILAECLEMEGHVSKDKEEKERLEILQNALNSIQDTLQSITDTKTLRIAYYDALRASIAKHSSKTLLGGESVNYEAVVSDLLAILSIP